MAVIRNIPAVIRIYHDLKYLKDYKHDMDAYRASGQIEKEREVIRQANISWGGNLIKVFRVDLTVIGKENLPKEGPVVYVSNHQGYADIPIWCNVLDTMQFGFVAKNNLSMVPTYGRWIDRIRSVMIERDEPREALKAIARGIDLINQGFSLLIFPEGHRARGPVMREFKKGSLKLATKPGVPIVPLSIEGSYHIYEETGVFRKDQAVKVMIHPPIETKGLDRKQEKALNDEVYQIIKEGHDKLLEL